MKTLLTGGTGYIGSAVLDRLIARRHAVVAVVRSDAAAAVVAGKGATPVVGDIADTAWLAERLDEVEGAIHLAAPGDDTTAAGEKARALGWTPAAPALVEELRAGSYSRSGRVSP